MMVKLTIDVDLVVCAAEVIAEAGDRLVVSKGVCLGVYTEDGVLGSKNLTPPERAQESFNNGSIISIMSHIPLSVRDICDCLNIPRGDVNVRAAIGRRVETLHKNGHVKMVPKPEGKTTKHFGKYYLDGGGV